MEPTQFKVIITPPESVHALTLSQLPPPLLSPHHLKVPTHCKKYDNAALNLLKKRYHIKLQSYAEKNEDIVFHYDEQSPFTAIKNALCNCCRTCLYYLYR